MKKSYKIIILIIVGIISIISILLCFISNRTKVNTTGIIGGADGPTSIFVASKSGNGMMIFGVIGVIVLIFIIVCIVALKKK